MSTRHFAGCNTVIVRWIPIPSLYIGVLRIPPLLLVFQPAGHSLPRGLIKFRVYNYDIQIIWDSLRTLFLWINGILLFPFLSNEARCDFLFCLPGILFCPSSSSDVRRFGQCSVKWAQHSISCRSASPFIDVDLKWMQYDMKYVCTLLFWSHICRITAPCCFWCSINYRCTPHGLHFLNTISAHAVFLNFKLCSAFVVNLHLFCNRCSSNAVLLQSYCTLWKSTECELHYGLCRVQDGW